MVSVYFSIETTESSKGSERDIILTIDTGKCLAKLI